MGTMKRRVCALAMFVLVVWVGPAGAQSVYTGVQPPNVGAADTGAVLGSSGGVVGSAGAVLSTSGGRLQVAQSARSSGGLAFTGIDVLSLVALGGGAIAIGAFLKQRARA